MSKPYSHEKPPEIEPLVEKHQQGFVRAVLSEADLVAVLGRKRADQEITVISPTPQGEDEYVDDAIEEAINRATGMFVGADSIFAVVLFPFSLVRMDVNPVWEPSSPVHDSKTLAAQLASALKLPVKVKLTILPEMTPLYEDINIARVQSLTSTAVFHGYPGKTFSFASPDIKIDDLSIGDWLAVAHRQLLVLLEIPRGEPAVLAEVQRRILEIPGDQPSAVMQAIKAQVDATWLQAGNPDRTQHAIFLPFGFANEVNELLNNLVLDSDIRALLLAAASDLDVEIKNLETEIRIGLPAGPNANEDQADIHLCISADGQPSSYALHWDDAHMVFTLGFQVGAIRHALEVLKVKDIVIRSNPDIQVGAWQQVKDFILTPVSSRRYQ